MKNNPTGAEVWVFNCHYNGLSIIQSMGRESVRTRALDSSRSIGTYSRYSIYHKVPDPISDEDGFIRALVELRKTVDHAPVLFPTNDHWAEAISKHKEFLARDFHSCVADHETVSLLLDKERFGYWAQIRGYSVPQVWSVQDAERDIDVLPFPVAVKAKSRRKAGTREDGGKWAKAADSLRFRPCESPGELRALLEEADHKGVAVFVQSLVQGRSDSMRTIGIYARNGKVLGLVYGKKHRGYPPQFGDCVVGIATKAPDWAIELVSKICVDLGYTGIAEFEVMEDAISGERFLIEINPRSWSWIGVCEPAGVNLPKIAYDDLALGHEPEQMVIGCADGRSVYYSKTLLDAQNCLLWYRFTDAKDWVMTPRQWLVEFKGMSGVTAEFARDDLLVAAVSVVHSVKQFLGRLVKQFVRRLV